MRPPLPMLLTPPRPAPLPMPASIPPPPTRRASGTSAAWGPVLKVAFGVVVVAALAVGAYLLYPTAVPDDLSLPAVDSGAVFGAELVERAERFERFLYVLWALGQIALLATLVVYARKGAVFMRESAAGPIGTGMLLGMLGLGIVWLVGLPFGLVAHWWARRYDQTDLNYFEWLVRGLGVARRRVHVHLVRPPRRDGPRALARGALVAPGRRGLHRRRRALHVRHSLSRLHDLRPRRPGAAGGGDASTSASWASRTCRSGWRR